VDASPGISLSSVLSKMFAKRSAASSPSRWYTPHDDASEVSSLVSILLLPCYNCACYERASSVNSDLRFCVSFDIELVILDTFFTRISWLGTEDTKYNYKSRHSAVTQRFYNKIKQNYSQFCRLL